MLFPVWVRPAHQPSRQAPPPPPPALQLPSPPLPAALHSSLLPVLQALISGCTAFFYPASLGWMTTQQFEWGVGLLMLAMGLSLTKQDFVKV